MTGRSRNLAACDRKTPYRTYASALLVAQRVNARKPGRTKRAPISVYRCDACSQYHVGNDRELKTKTRASARVDRKRTRARLRSELGRVD